MTGPTPKPGKAKRRSKKSGTAGSSGGAGKKAESGAGTPRKPGALADRGNKRRDASAKATPRLRPTGRSRVQAPAPVSLFEDQPDAAVSPREQYMSMGDHLEELRKRLLWIAAVTLASAVAAGVFIYPVHDFLIAPYLAVTAKANPGGLNLILRQVPGPLVVLLKLAVAVGFGASLPLTISILWGFVSPAVSRKTAYAGHSVVIASSVLFWAGVFVCWRFIFPVALQFMLIEALPSRVSPQLTLEDYYSFVFFLHIGTGLGFQLPLIVVILGFLGILTMQWHATAWKYVVTGTFIFAAIATPPDPITQLVLAGALLALYSVALLIVWIFERARRRRP